MGYVFDNLRVARGRLWVVGAARQRRCWRISGTLLAHSLHLALLRLRELGGDDDQAQVDHEERANLQHEQNKCLIKTRIWCKIRLEPATGSTSADCASAGKATASLCHKLGQHRNRQLQQAARLMGSSGCCELSNFWIVVRSMTFAANWLSCQFHLLSPSLQRSLCPPPTPHSLSLACFRSSYADGHPLAAFAF